MLRVPRALEGTCLWRIPSTHVIAFWKKKAADNDEAPGAPRPYLEGTGRSDPTSLSERLLWGLRSHGLATVDADPPHRPPAATAPS